MKRLRLVVLSLYAALLVALASHGLVQRSLTLSLHSELDQSALLTRRAVEAEIDRFRALPSVAGEDARIQAALADPSALAAANRYLQSVAAHAGASELFLINAEGLTIAASNWDKPGSFVGQNYSFRPYFKQAMQSGHGQFYAIGVTTGVPGYFLSSRVQSGGLAGVLVIKVDLRPLQMAWQAAGALTALADADGVVFLSGRDDWLYRPLSPLPAEALARLSADRTYDGQALHLAEPLLLTTAGADATGPGWFARLSALPGSDWRLVTARPTRAISLPAAAAALGAGLLTLVAAALLKALEQRRQIVALRLSQSERLEAMVAARTHDLAREVEARVQAEADLRQAQEHLVHSEKMAALGRMSSAIVHEISQPLAAMEATLTAAELSLPPGNAATATRLGTAKGLIRRMQRTTKHLKSFARKETGQLTLVDLRPVVASAIELVTPRAHAVGIMPAFVPPAGPVTVMAGAVRLEQVVVNLLLNALDAVEGRPDPRIDITLKAEAGQAQLQVQDTGCGISAELLERVAEPFFSTKVQGEGLGLGLSISNAILSEFGGGMVLHSSPGQGTTVCVHLPLAETTGETR